MAAEQFAWLWMTGPGLILLGAGLGVVYAILPKQGGIAGLRTVVAAGAVLSAVIGVGLWAGLGTLPTTTTTAGGAAGYTVTLSAGEVQNVSNLVIDNLNHKVQVQVQCTSSCASFSYGSGTVELNFTISRSDTGTQDVSTPLVVNTIAQVAKSDGSGTYYPIVGLNADGTYKSDWEKGPNASPAVNNKQTTVLLAGGGSNYARLNVTWGITAVAQQNVYQTADVTCSIAGQSWTITEILTIKV